MLPPSPLPPPAFLRSLVVAATIGLLLTASTAASARPVAPRGDLTAEERVTIDIFERAKRSVVYISTSERIRDLWTRNVHTIPRGTGSGFVWDDQGGIVTNYHVIARASR
jgi:S1-C subfamily serine protease